MKKLMIAILVMAAAGVYAQVSVENYDNGIISYNDGIFTVLANGSLTLTYYSPDTKYGQIEEFGYYMESNPSKHFVLDTKLTGNESITISGLKEGDKIGFYADTKFSHKGDKNVTVYSSMVDLANTLTSFKETDYGYTFGDVKWESRVLAFAMSTTPAPEPEPPAPTGQPLPGALTTMLVAGGCAAFLRKRKAARK